MNSAYRPVARLSLGSRPPGIRIAYGFPNVRPLWIVYLTVRTVTLKQEKVLQDFRTAFERGAGERVDGRVRYQIGR